MDEGADMVERDYKFLVSTLSGDRTESFGLGNIYTTRQMKQWIEFFLEHKYRRYHRSLKKKDPAGAAASPSALAEQGYQVWLEACMPSNED